MKENYELIRDLKRKLNSIEHMLYVSSKFSRTTEMLKNIMSSIVSGYEMYFAVTYEVLISPEEKEMQNTFQDKIQLLNDALMMRGIAVDLSDYFLLKRLLISEFENVGEYRKNLSLISYIDGEEYIINVQKLIDFYENLKQASQGLYQLEA